MTTIASQDQDPPADDIAEQATAWLVRLSSDDTAEADRAGFEAWKRADPRHARAAARLEGLIGEVKTLRGGSAGRSPVYAALNAAMGSPGKARRKKYTGTILAAVLTLFASLWLSLQSYPLSYLTADLSTSTAQWETHALPDASQLSLSGKSAVNIRFDARRRTVDLVSGEILVDVAADPARPFVVETSHGSIRALGTRFIVRQDDDAVILSMLESSAGVRVKGRLASERDDVVIDAGQRVRIARDGVGPIETIDANRVSNAWNKRQLIMLNRPLSEVLDELARHRSGYIHFDRDRLAGIRVSVVLPLDDSDRALDVLADSFSLRVRSFTPWVVVVEAPARL